MSKRLAVLVLFALPLAGLACSGPSGLRADGTLSVRGSTAGGPFDASFTFPHDTLLDGRAGLTAMCTVSRGAENGAVVDLIVPSGATSPLEGVSFTTRNGAASGMVDADVRGTHYSSTCDYAVSVVGNDGAVQVLTDGDCTLTDDAGTSTITASINLTLFGCTVIDG